MAIAAAGGQTALGRIIGRRQSSIQYRLEAGKSLWAKDVLKVEAATGVSRHDLRPDLYPPDEGSAHPEPVEGYPIEPAPAGRTDAGSAPPSEPASGSGAPARRGLPAPSTGRSAHSLGEAAR